MEAAETTWAIIDICHKHTNYQASHNHSLNQWNCSHSHAWLAEREGPTISAELVKLRNGTKRHKLKHAPGTPKKTPQRASSRSSHRTHHPTTLHANERAGSLSPSHSSHSCKYYASTLSAADLRLWPLLWSRLGLRARWRLCLLVWRWCFTPLFTRGGAGGLATPLPGSGRRGEGSAGAWREGSICSVLGRRISLGTLECVPAV